MKEVTCCKCGWVHYEMSMEEIVQNVKTFNDYYDTLTETEQQTYYGGNKSSIERYTKCLNCGNIYTDFRDSKEGDCPDGCTINPIMTRH